jgi:hypothetical protein
MAMRKRNFMLLPLLGVSLAACAAKPVRTGGPLPPQLRACNPDVVQDEVGKAATAERIEAIRVRSGSKVVRVLRPGQMMTMDFRGDRVDVHVDAQDLIVSVSCG